MKCARCQHENRPGAKFCEECAAPLARACANCGAQLSSTAKFCSECAHPTESAPLLGPNAARFASPESYTPKHLAERILTSKAALEGERKQVTVLFADLKGSMELLADRDPEEARKLLDPVLERMMGAVHRYEGTVNQVMGDGIMALFGAPLAHEDHAVRACYAALRMQESVKQYADEVRRSHAAVVKIRIGLNSGEVVVRAIGSDLHMDYTAVGHTTHLAARMEQLADPGAIVITPDTLALAEGYVEVKSLGPMPVKGLADPVEVFEVTGAGPARTRLQASARRGLTRFVGRDAELEQLRRAQQLAGEARGQVAAVVGEAGAGKSRLIYEFTHSHRLQGWLTLEAASVSYGKATSYLPVIELLKGYFKIQDRDDLRQIRKKVTGKLLTLDRALEPTLPAFLALLDVPLDDSAWQALDARQRRQLTLDAVKRLLLREARQHPLLLVFEDLHWIDGETQAVLDSLVETLGSARLMLLVSYRPEYRHGWGSKTYYSQLRLDTLKAESTGELLDTLLGEEPGLAPLKQLLVRRGNPFFLEETVRMLVETKALAGERGRYRLTKPLQAIQVPATVQTILAARIDRLSAEDKRLLQTAAVVGKDVPLVLLRGIAELREEALRAGLDRLQSAELIQEIGLYPDLEYAFKHALTHEVTYSSLLHDRRREVHGRIVTAIEAIYQERLGEQTERLAHHATRGQLGEKAVHYIRQAGLRASARSALPEAQAWLEQALEVLETVPESRAVLEQGVDIRLELRPVLTQLAEIPRCLERLREADALAEQLKDDRRRGHISALVMNIHSDLGELDEAQAFGIRAVTIARTLGDLDLRVLATSFLAHTHYLRGDYEQVVELTTENLAALPADRVHEDFGTAAPASVYDRCQLVVSLAQLGRFAEAAEHEAEAMRLAEPTQNAYAVAVAHWAGCTLHTLKSDWTKLHSLVEQWIAWIRTRNVFRQLPYAVASSAWVRAQMGEVGEALDRLREGHQLLERQTARGLVGQRGWAFYALGRAGLLLGRLDEARSLSNRAIESSPCHPGYMAHALHLLGHIAAHPDRFDADSAEAHYRHALALAEPRGMRPLVAHCHLGLSNLYRQTDKREQAYEHLTTATTMYREMDMRFGLEQAEVEMRELA
jgi:class 3 adenylate cyclase/tetratricopeptide (TPR) repeat protein